MVTTETVHLNKVHFKFDRDNKMSSEFNTKAKDVLIIGGKRGELRVNSTSFKFFLFYFCFSSPGDQWLQLHGGELWETSIHPGPSEGAHPSEGLPALHDMRRARMPITHRHLVPEQLVHQLGQKLLHHQHVRRVLPVYPESALQGQWRVQSCGREPPWQGRV